MTTMGGGGVQCGAVGSRRGPILTTVWVCVWELALCGGIEGAFIGFDAHACWKQFSLASWRESTGKLVHDCCRTFVFFRPLLCYGCTPAMYVRIFP